MRLHRHAQTEPRRGWQSLPADLLHMILDMLPDADRAVARLVSRDWATAPLHSAFARNGTACTKLMPYIQGAECQGADERRRTPALMRFADVHSLELCSGSYMLPSQLAEALNSRACRRSIEYVAIGGIFDDDMRNERLVQVLAGSGIKHLRLGSARGAAIVAAPHKSGKMWASGRVRLGFTGGFERLETVTAAAHPTSPVSTELIISYLPSLRRVSMVNVVRLTISDRLSPDMVIKVDRTHGNPSTFVYVDQCQHIVHWRFRCSAFVFRDILASRDSRLAARLPAHA